LHDGNQEAKSHFSDLGKVSFILIKLPENKKKLKGTEGVNFILHVSVVLQRPSEAYKLLPIFNNNLKNVNHDFTLQ
jgi:hypothetical protein